MSLDVMATQCVLYATPVPIQIGPKEYIKRRFRLPFPSNNELWGEKGVMAKKTRVVPCLRIHVGDFHSMEQAYTYPYLSILLLQCNEFACPSSVTRSNLSSVN